MSSLLGFERPVFEAIIIVFSPVICILEMKLARDGVFAMNRYGIM